MKALDTNVIVRYLVQDNAAQFADCLVGQLNRVLGAEPTATFDLSLRKLATFQLL